MTNWCYLSYSFNDTFQRCLYDYTSGFRKEESLNKLNKIFNDATNLLSKYDIKNCKYDVWCFCRIFIDCFHCLRKRIEKGNKEFEFIFKYESLFDRCWEIIQDYLYIDYHNN